MIRKTRLVALTIVPFAWGCVGGPTQKGDGADPVEAALTTADEYVSAYFDQFPEEAFEAGFPDAPTDRFSDRSAGALAAWHEREDRWLERLAAIDPGSLAGTDAAAPYAYARERLEASQEMRACRMPLWNVSATASGWPGLLAMSFANQPVATPEDRAATMALARDAARFVRTELENLTKGLGLGYTAAVPNVDAVLGLIDEILGAELEATPFWSPAERDESGELAEALPAVVENEIRPAIQSMREFLAGPYREGARQAIGVDANPEGADCYRAAIRFHTTLRLGPDEIHQNGLDRMAEIEAEMLEITRRRFGTDDVPAVLERLRSEREFTFGSEEEILEFVHAAIDRARAATPQWFGLVPKGEVVVRPYPAYQRRTGGGFYSGGGPDKPGVYELGTHEPTELPRAGLEATTFHETYPGHHQQVKVALERPGLHPVLKYFFNSGMGEGWALYSERLADEMGLYSDDVDRLGMLSNEAFRAARLVVDPGMHALGWSRERAVDYMRTHTAESESSIEYEVNRYLAMPAQATAYLTGSLEIQRLRAEAETRLGEHFDIRSFHDRVLEDGTITLGMLGEKIEAWIASQEG
jgi:uncharacterized protein (DUF885 family)